MLQPKHLVGSLLLPLLIQAAGIGFSIPLNITEKERISYSDYRLDSATYTYKPSTGLGFVFDTNVGKDRDFSYRLNLEYSLAEIDSSSRLYSDSYSKHKYSIVNTFGFSLYHNRYIRLWVGPRINLQIEHASSSTNIRHYNSYGIGFAAAAGLNIRLTSKMALGVDVDYHGLRMLGGESYRDYDGATIGDTTYYTVLTGSNKGTTARFYFLVKFGEQYEQNKASTHTPSIIDPTL